MSHEIKKFPKKRHAVFALFFVALLPVAYKEYIADGPPAPPIPEKYLENLRERSSNRNADLGFTYITSTGTYLASANRRGMDISEQIRTLRDPSLAPDLVYEQFNCILEGCSLNGSSRLSARERAAVAEVALAWPERFEPYFRGPTDATTREELLNRLRETSPLMTRSLEKARDTETPIARQKNSN